MTCRLSLKVDKPLSKRSDDPHLHVDALVGVVVGVFGGAYDLISDFHTPDYLTEGSVLLIEEEGVSDTNKELAAGAVGVLGARHRDDAAFVGGVVKLGLDGVAGAAGAVLRARLG